MSLPARRRACAFMEETMGVYGAAVKTSVANQILDQFEVES
jgi:hypothetical protein